MSFEFLLARAMTQRDAAALAVVRRGLDAMADGGIHDQLGGGFHRYATDSRWLVPHFEQMLYDNAQLARVYLHAWAVTREGRYRDVAIGTLDFLLRDLLRDDGTFAASLDADTDGVEGGTFTWHASEIRDVLGEAAGLFDEAYGVTEAGNWEGATILSRVRTDAELAAGHGLTEAAVASRLAAARASLLDVRSRRPQPARDDKALAAWNGLAIGALADAARLLGRGAGPDGPDDRAQVYLAAAMRAAEAILAGLLDDAGRLRRSWKDGRASGPGVLEDYAALAVGLLALYEASFDERWFAAARSLLEVVLGHFADPDGGFYDTADDHERLVARPKDVQDNATPSGNALATLGLLRVAAYTGDSRYRIAAERAISRVTPFAVRYPTAFAMWLQAVDLAWADVVEIAIVGEPEGPAWRALLAVAHAYDPHRVVAAAPPGVTTRIPLLEDRPAQGGQPTAYVCRQFACRAPVTDPEALAEQLAEHAAVV
jgi:hypothetical protein